MELNNQPYVQIVTTLFEEGLKGNRLTERLKQDGLDDQAIEACVSIAKKLHYAQQQKFGVKLLMLGVLFCVSSGLFTFLYSQTDAYAAAVLYGLTGIGACFVLGGLAYIFGL